MIHFGIQASWVRMDEKSERVKSLLLAWPCLAGALRRGRSTSGCLQMWRKDSVSFRRSSTGCGWPPRLRWTASPLIDRWGVTDDVPPLAGGPPIWAQSCSGFLPVKREFFLLLFRPFAFLKVKDMMTKRVEFLDEVPKMPDFIIALRPHTVWEKTPIKLFCTVQGNPRPIVKWSEHSPLNDFPLNLQICWLCLN